jgi:hypothetical protein
MVTANQLRVEIIKGRVRGVWGELEMYKRGKVLLSHASKTVRVNVLLSNNATREQGQQGFC